MTSTITTTFTGSLRKESGKNEKLKLYLNFRKEHVERLKLNENKFVEITRKDDTFKLKFLQRKTPRTTEVSMSGSGARLSIDPTRFKISFNEPTDASTFFAEYLEDQTGLKFDFNLDMFSKPREEQRPLAVIETAEEKRDAGFEPDSDWGVKLQSQVSKEIKAKMKKYMQAKFIMDQDDGTDSNNT
jgi:hypothetical protein